MESTGTPSLPDICQATCVVTQQPFPYYLKQSLYIALTHIHPHKNYIWRQPPCPHKKLRVSGGVYVVEMNC